MSRIGKKPIEVPSGVTVSVADGVVTVKGPKGSNQVSIGRGTEVKVDGSTVSVELTANDKQSRANFGTARSIISGMVAGVTGGYKKTLLLNGVGYTAAMAGKQLKLNCGYSHQVFLDIPQGIICKVEKESIEIEGSNKQLVGQFTAKIRDVHPPEPYLGKGIRLSDEHVRRKAGKTGK
ncbi:MAG: 50S ribosomal protein L6 [Bdellovibrionales bacterium]|nr:50S ribosomal protein L6 [Bdellovibrionales bacterium]